MRYVAGGAVIVGFVALGVWVFLRSYRRNQNIFGRTRVASALVAGAAVWFWPLTLAWWLFGPTPERRRTT